MCERERSEKSERATFRQPSSAANESGWTEVKHRRPPTITSFFVYNLPPSTTNQTLKELFQIHGNFVDAYIPKKKDKYDNIFGFIRFRNVSHPQSFLPRLQNTRIDNLILSVHIAKNDKKGRTVNYPPPNPKPYTHPKPSHTQNPNPSPHPKPSYTQNPNPFNPPFPTSYRDSLINNPHPYNLPTVNLTKSKLKTPNGWKKLAVTAKVKDFSTLQNPKNLLNEPEIKEVTSISYLGGLSLLLLFNASVTAKDFIHTKEKFLRKWFSSYEIWNGQDVITGRVVNVNILGMPLPLWDNESFDRVAATMGKILVRSAVNYLNKNLSVGSVTILVDSHKKIDEQVRIIDGNKSFIVRIVEDGSSWWPQFLNDPEYSETCADSGSVQPEKSCQEVNMNDASPDLGKNNSSGIPKASAFNAHKNNSYSQQSPPPPTPPYPLPCMQTH